MRSCCLRAVFLNGNLDLCVRLTCWLSTTMSSFQVYCGKKETNIVYVLITFVSPWYDLRGWLGVKQQLSIYLSKCSARKILREKYFFPHSLVCLSSVRWHNCILLMGLAPDLCRTIPRLASLQSEAFIVLSFTASWSRLRGFSRDRSVLWPAPLSVWFASVGDMAWKAQSQWVCPWFLLVSLLNV